MDTNGKTDFSESSSVFFFCSYNLKFREKRAHNTFVPLAYK